MTNNRVDKGSKANFRSARILLIEDNPDQLWLMKTSLRRCMPEVIVLQATTADQALDCLQQCSPEDGEMPKLILLDLYLPDRTDGWALLKTIRSLPFPYSRIPVVVLSASADPTDITQSYRQGASSYLVKPLIIDEWTRLFAFIRSYWWETVILPDATIY